MDSLTKIRIEILTSLQVYVTNTTQNRKPEQDILGIFFNILRKHTTITNRCSEMMKYIRHRLVRILTNVTIVTQKVKCSVENSKNVPIKSLDKTPNKTIKRSNNFQQKQNVYPTWHTIMSKLMKYYATYYGRKLKENGGQSMYRQKAK